MFRSHAEIVSGIQDSFRELAPAIARVFACVRIAETAPLALLVKAKNANEVNIQATTTDRPTWRSVGPTDPDLDRKARDTIGQLKAHIDVMFWHDMRFSAATICPRAIHFHRTVAESPLISDWVSRHFAVRLAPGRPFTEARYVPVATAAQAIARTLRDGDRVELAATPRRLAAMSAHERLALAERQALAPGFATEAAIELAVWLEGYQWLEDTIFVRRAGDFALVLAGHSDHPGEAICFALADLAEDTPSQTA